MSDSAQLRVAKCFAFVLVDRLRDERHRVNPRTAVALRERYLICEDGPLHLPSCAMDFKLTTVGEYKAAELYDKVKAKAKA